MYGPFTVGGAINLTTREIPGRFSTEGALTYGTFGTNTAHAWVGELRNRYVYKGSEPWEPQRPVLEQKIAKCDF